MKETVKIKILKKVSPKISLEIKSLVLQLSGTIKTEKISFWLKKILKTKTASFIIALDKKNKIVGMVVLVTYPVIDGFNKGWIEGMVVDENARRMGIGEKLMLKALEVARKKGLKNINLTSRPQRVAANKFYQKIGFEKQETNVYRLEL